MTLMRRRVWPGMLALLCLIASTIIAAPLPGLAEPAHAASGPDLTIQTLAWSPQTPSLGDQVHFDITIANQGDDIAGNSRLLLSIDGHITDSASISAINQGKTVSYIFTWKATAGAHIVKVTADSEEAVAESNETNNEKSYAFSVLAPDLVINSITWLPEKPSIGDSMQFIISIQNLGDRTANTNWVELFIDGASRGQREGQPLNPGASYTSTYTWVAQPGQHVITACADVLQQSAESDETNNDLTVFYCTTPPDLTVSSLTFSPANRTESGNVTMSTVITNAGEGVSPGSYLTYYIDGIPLTPLYINSLGSGATATLSYNWHPDLEEHIFTATIDPENRVFETVESNNTRSVTIPALGLPELYIQSITLSPQIPTINSRVTINVTVKNSGTRTVDKSELAVYITGGTRITKQSGAIAPGSTVTLALQWITGTVPQNIRAVIDEANQVQESNEANNEMLLSVTPQTPVPSADLTVESITCTPSNPAVDETVTITASVKNAGSSASGSFSAVCFIDNKTIGSIYFDSLQPGETGDGGIRWKATSGDHRFSIIVDFTDHIYETNETNNEAAATIVTTDPDLTIAAIEWFPVYPEPGQDVQFTFTIVNQGRRASVPCFITYYIDGTKQGEHYLEAIEGGASLTRTFSWNMQTETHTLRAVLDMAGTVRESNEANNEKSVYLPAPDLTVKSITFSDDYPLADTLLSFTIDILNAGRSLAGISQVNGYIDGSALASIETGVIDAGQSAESVFYWTAVPGKHTLRIVADSKDALTESNEGNNVKEVIIFVPLPASSSATPTEPVEDTGNITETDNVTGDPLPLETVLTEEDFFNNLFENSENETIADISANISAPPDETPSGGIKDVLMNKWLIIGVAAAGIGCIGVLLFLRKRSSGPKKEKTPKAPKPPKPPKPAKPAKPDKKQEKPVKKAPAPLPPTGTLSGKPPVSVPPLPKPNAAGVVPPVKPVVPLANPNLGTTLIKQNNQAPHAPAPLPTVAPPVNPAPAAAPATPPAASPPPAAPPPPAA